MGMDCSLCPTAQLPASAVAGKCSAVVGLGCSALRKRLVVVVVEKVVEHAVVVVAAVV